MGGINVCVSLGSNQGKDKCEVRMKRPKRLLLGNYEFTKDELKDSDSLKAAIKRQMLKANTDSGKIFLSPVLRVVTDNTGDPNTQALADGYEEVLNEAIPKYSYQFTAGVCQHQAWAAMNGWGGGNFRVDQDNVFWYRVTESGGGKGFSTGNLYTDPPRDGSSGAIAVGTTRITFGDIDEFKSGIGAVKINFNIADLANIVDVDLEDREDAFNSPSTSTNVFYIGGKVVCQGDDIYAAYKTALNNVNRWTAKRLDNGAALTIDSISTDDNLEAWKPVINSAEWAALPSGTKVEINIASPEVLNGYGVTGIEGGGITFQKA
jgi:hypothetical protein